MFLSDQKNMFLLICSNISFRKKNTASPQWDCETSCGRCTPDAPDPSNASRPDRGGRFTSTEAGTTINWWTQQDSREAKKRSKNLLPRILIFCEVHPKNTHGMPESYSRKSRWFGEVFEHGICGGQNLVEQCGVGLENEDTKRFQEMLRSESHMLWNGQLFHFLCNTYTTLWQDFLNKEALLALGTVRLYFVFSPESRDQEARRFTQNDTTHIEAPAGPTLSCSQNHVDWHRVLTCCDALICSVRQRPSIVKRRHCLLNIKRQNWELFCCTVKQTNTPFHFRATLSSAAWVSLP